MTSDDTTGRGGDDAAGHSRGSSGDPLRDFLLGLAGQIDQLAAVFGGTGPRRPAATGPRADSASADAANLADLSGEITSLLSELGDLLARLIAALIAVLEAIASALRSTPPMAGNEDPAYQPISVRIDLGGRDGARRPHGESES
ncbi:hypothetical protein VZC37_18940 [Gordonia sp. LSe1-13]|uniref:Uncharacterized protein n=1 Tax=Gordonia sesuvii TaxID=3116777 RepID=A0ABU7MH53_9ACTN|nr:hypothetical protein [Gordonia sp. LSe1-13]